MIVHKWVESLALSSMCIRAGARWWHLLLVLVPFGVMGFVGVAIGVSVTDSSTWAEMVLFALIAGAPHLMGVRLWCLCLVALWVSC